MSIVQIHNDSAGTATCPDCGALVASDQRYCLSCGKPCSPRPPFLDVLQHGAGLHLPGPPGSAQNGYLPPLPQSASAPLHRYTGLFALLGVLLLTGVIGLLIGHWVGGSGGGGAQVIKVEGLAGAATPAAATAVTTTSSTTSAAAKTGEPGGREHETKQEERETAASNLAPPVKPSASRAKRLSKLTGRRYEQEINKVASGTAPIETGG